MSGVEIRTSRNLFGEVENELPLIDRAWLADILRKRMHGMTAADIAALLTDEFTETIEYCQLLRGEKAGQKTSLLFNPHRLAVDRFDSNAITSRFADPEWFSGLARAVLFKHGKVSELLYQVLQLGINSLTYVNEFPPHAARDIHKAHHINAHSRILDPCGGWGGRMLGASAVANSYTCCEPALETAYGLRKLSEFIRSMRPDFSADVRPTPFEDERGLECGSFDIALTSPPYYDTERYSDEETNSCNRYADFEAWCSGFFAPLVVKTVRLLKPGAPFIINIGSRVYPLRDRLKHTCKMDSLICEEINSPLSGKAGLSKSGHGEEFFRIRRKP